MPGWVRAVLLTALLEQLGPAFHSLQDKMGRSLYPCPLFLEFLGFPEQARVVKVTIVWILKMSVFVLLWEMKWIFSWAVAE